MRFTKTDAWMVGGIFVALNAILIHLIDYLTVWNRELLAAYEEGTLAYLSLASQALAWSNIYVVAFCALVLAFKKLVFG